MPDSKKHIGITTTYLVIYILKFNRLDLILKYYKMCLEHVSLNPLDMNDMVGVLYVPVCLPKLDVKGH